MNRYQNFDLELANYRLDPECETLVARVVDSPVGAQRQSEASTVDFPTQLRGRLAKLERRDLTLEELILLGEELANLLLPPSAREFYRRSLARLGDLEGLRIRIRADTPELAELPWEYAYVGRAHTPTGRKGPDGFLALDRKLSLVRYEILGEPAVSTSPRGQGPMRVVAVLSEVRDPAYAPLDLAQEELNLRQALDDVGGIEARFLRPGTLDQLEEVLTEGAQAFHFAGHGELLREMGEKPGTFEGRGRLILAGDDGRPAPLDADRLAQELRGRGVRLAVLGACEAARRDPVTPWSGVAPALVRQGIPAVVGMQYTVRDGNAVAFSRRFYRALAAGKSVDTAVSDGRLGVFNRGGGSDRDWGVPVLYLRTEQSVLFPAPLAPLRWNLALAIVAIGVLSLWFYWHIYPLVAHGTARWMGRAGLGVGALAGLVAVWKMVGSFVLKTVRRREQGSTVERWLRHRHARKLLVPLVVAALVLLATTSSVYLSLDTETTEAVEIAVETTEGFRWSPMPTLAASGLDGLAGGPVLFRPPPRELVLRVVEPVGWRVNAGDGTVHPRPWRSIDLRVSRDLTAIELRTIRLVGRSDLVSLLAEPTDASPDRTFALRVTVGNSPPVELPDLRQGVVYLGGPRQVLEAQVEVESIDARLEALKSCVVPPRSPDRVRKLMAYWEPEVASRRHFLDTPVLGAEQSVLVEVIEVIDGAQSETMSEKTLEADKLLPGRINTFCLSKKVRSP